MRLARQASPSGNAAAAAAAAVAAGRPHPLLLAGAGACEKLRLQQTRQRRALGQLHKAAEHTCLAPTSFSRKEIVVSKRAHPAQARGLVPHWE